MTKKINSFHCAPITLNPPLFAQNQSSSRFGFTLASFCGVFSLVARGFAMPIQHYKTSVFHRASVIASLPGRGNPEKTKHKSFSGLLRSRWSLAMTLFNQKQSIRRLGFNPTSFCKAFSLVEMLMALLVASLLMAALAPVMTRRVNEPDIRIMTEASNYDKDSVITIFTDSSETKEFNIPTDANRINITMMGGGGAGGEALYGNKTFTSTQDFTIPKNVKKLRVFMIGGGGGGASGGVGSGTVYKTIPATAEQSQSYTAGGQYTFGSSYISKAQKIPALDEKCAASNIDKWTHSNNESLKFTAGESILRITACGGGGGGGGYNSASSPGGGGGSGGYFEKRLLIIPSNVDSLQVNVGGYGGSGGLDNALGGNGGSWQGGAGGSGAATAATSPTQNGSGSGGTCPTDYGSYGGLAGLGCSGHGEDSIASGTKILNKIINGGNGQQGGGNGGSSGASDTSNSFMAGGGGGGGCLTAGGGGGGSGSGSGGGGGGATFITNYMNFNNISLVAPGGGGGGGGGWSSSIPANQGGGGGGGGGLGGGNGGNGGGTSSVSDSRFTRQAGWPGKGGIPAGENGKGSDGSDSTGGTITTIFGTSNCNGGNYTTNGKPGAMRIYYGGEALEDYIKCDYNITANGGGGGAAGQVTINEINVTPGETLTFEIGAGGVAQNEQGKDGNAGKATYIKRGTYILASAAGGYGGEYSSSETTPSQGGSFRNPNIGTNWTNVDYKNNNSFAAGSNGNLASAATNVSYGGSGGYSQDINGNLVSGGIGGNTAKDGMAPLANNYGAGGGGGSGSQSVGDGTYGKGGAGAAGYIYIEWGGTNGGGGTVGEIVQSVLTNFDQADRKMIINIGKGGNNATGDGNGGITTLSVKSGGKQVNLSARGGIRGDDGHVNKGEHGEEMKYPTNYDATYKKFVQENLNIILGQKGINEYGGMGGYLACIFNSKDSDGNTICSQSVTANDGIDNSAGPIRPGCGGSTIPSPLYDAICRAASTMTTADGGPGQFGGGGGGGAVLDSIGGKGGNGGDGFVILEYKSVQ